MAFVNPVIIAPNAVRYSDDTNKQKFKTEFYARNRWLLDGEQYKSRKRTTLGQDLEIETAHFKVRSNQAIAGFDFGPVTKRVLVERKVGQAWLEEGLPLIDNSIVSETADNAIYEWNFGALLVRLEVNEAVGKWTYIYTAAGNNTYRIKIINQCPTADIFRTRVNKTGSMYQAEWSLAGKNYRYNWRDMLPVTETINGKEVILTSPEQALTIGQQIILDPSFSDDADWGADVDDTSATYPNDGADWCGDDSGTIFRTVNKHDVTSLPTDATVDQIDYEIGVVAVNGAGSSLWRGGGYAGTGQGDPEADSAATVYSNCDISSDNWVTGITAFRTTGTKTLTDLGATANADLEAARDAGTDFSVVFQMETEGAGDDRCEFREYTDGTTPPKLTVTYTEAGAGSILPMIMQNTNQFNGGLNA